MIFEGSGSVFVCFLLSLIKVIVSLGKKCDLWKVKKPKKNLGGPDREKFKVASKVKNNLAVKKSLDLGLYKVKSRSKVKSSSEIFILSLKRPSRT